MVRSNNRVVCNILFHTVLLVAYEAASIIGPYNKGHGNYYQVKLNVVKSFKTTELENWCKLHFLHAI